MTGTIKLQHHRAVVTEPVAFQRRLAIPRSGNRQHMAVPLRFALEPGLLDGGVMAGIGGEAAGGGLIGRVEIEIALNEDIAFPIVDRDVTSLDDRLTVKLATGRYQLPDAVQTLVIVRECARRKH